MSEGVILLAAVLFVIGIPVGYFLTIRFMQKSCTDDDDDDVDALVRAADAAREAWRPWHKARLKARVSYDLLCSAQKYEGLLDELTQAELDRAKEKLEKELGVDDGQA